MPDPYFTPRLFEFLTDLKAHNTRPWFEANRQRYEKDFYTMRAFADRHVTARDFMDRFLESARAAAPLVRFLTETLHLPW